MSKYPVPEICIYCGSKVIRSSNADIYGKEYGNGICYRCTNCDSYVGVHPDLFIPLGRLADRELRSLIKKAHSLFDPLWINIENKKEKKKARGRCYNRLADQLEIDVKDCHFGYFDKDTIIKAITVLESGIIDGNKREDV